MQLSWRVPCCGLTGLPGEARDLLGPGLRASPAVAGPGALGCMCCEHINIALLHGHLPFLSVSHINK